MIHTYNNNALFTRLTALLLVAAIFVGTTLPLVWCFGGADHSAIEMKVGVTSAAPQTVQSGALSPQQASIAEDDQAHPHECVDREAFPTAALSKEPDQLIAAGISQPCPDADLMPHEANPAAVVHIENVPWVSLTDDFPNLKLLRAVILLI